jgi:hypothetical protein
MYVCVFVTNQRSKDDRVKDQSDDFAIQLLSKQVFWAREFSQSGNFGVPVSSIKREHLS